MRYHLTPYAAHECTTFHPNTLSLSPHLTPLAVFYPSLCLSVSHSLFPSLSLPLSPFLSRFFRHHVSLTPLSPPPPISTTTTTPLLLQSVCSHACVCVSLEERENVCETEGVGREAEDWRRREKRVKRRGGCGGLGISKEALGGKYHLHLWRLPLNQSRSLASLTARDHLPPTRCGMSSTRGPLCECECNLHLYGSLRLITGTDKARELRLLRFNRN